MCTCLEDAVDVDAGEVDLVGGELPGGQQLLHLNKIKNNWWWVSK